MNNNEYTFIPLDKMGLTNEDMMETYSILRGAYEDTYPDKMVDASDVYVLTVFPFAKNDEWADDYEVTDYETGFFHGTPSLRNCTNKSEILCLTSLDSPMLLTTRY